MVSYLESECFMEIDIDNSMFKTETTTLSGSCQSNQEDNEYRNKYLYLAADFDNYKKRMAKELANSKFDVKQNFAKDLLPIIDDLERLLDEIDDESPTKNEIGFQMIAENLEKMLAANNCNRLEINIGDKFDVNLHDAICTSMVEDESLDDTIAEVFQCGWMLNDKVIRHAKVKVNKSGIL